MKKHIMGREGLAGAGGQPSDSAAGLDCQQAGDAAPQNPLPSADAAHKIELVALGQGAAEREEEVGRQTQQQPAASAAYFLSDSRLPSPGQLAVAQKPSPLDAFLAKGAGGAAAQMLGVCGSLVLAPHAADPPKSAASQQSPVASQPAAHRPPALSPRPRENKRPGAHAKEDSNAHSSPALAPSKMGKGSGARASTAGLHVESSVPPLSGARQASPSRKPADAFKEAACWTSGPARAAAAPTNPRASPKLSPKIDGSKPGKVRQEGNTEEKASSASRLQRDESTIRTHPDNPREKSELAGKEHVVSKVLPSVVSAPRAESHKGSSVDKARCSLSKAASPSKGGNILEGIGERIKRRSKPGSTKMESGPDDDDDDEVDKTAKRRRTMQRTSSSEEEDEDEDDGDDGAEDDNGVPRLEARMMTVKGAWWDIELLACDPSGDNFHVRTRDQPPDKEWVTAGDIRRQCKVRAASPRRREPHADRAAAGGYLCGQLLVAAAGWPAEGGCGRLGQRAGLAAPRPGGLPCRAMKNNIMGREGLAASPAIRQRG